MTNAETLKIFEQKYPDAEVTDYRPLDDMFIPKEQAGIIIWLENGDIIIYFPNENKVGLK